MLEVGRLVSGSWLFIFPLFLLGTHRGRHSSRVTRLAPRRLAADLEADLTAHKSSWGSDRLMCAPIGHGIMSVRQNISQTGLGRVGERGLTAPLFDSAQKVTQISLRIPRFP